jgi:hypothetical protein
MVGKTVAGDKTQLKYSNESLKSKLNCVNFVYLHQIVQILWLVC